MSNMLQPGSILQHFQATSFEEIEEVDEDPTPEWHGRDCCCDGCIESRIP